MTQYLVVCWFSEQGYMILTLRAPMGGGGSKTNPLGFSSVVFARGMILQRNFG